MMNCVCRQDDNGDIIGGLCGAHTRAARLVFPPVEATDDMARAAHKALGHCEHCISRAEIDMYKRIYSQMVLGHFRVDQKL